MLRNSHAGEQVNRRDDTRRLDDHCSLPKPQFATPKAMNKVAGVALEEDVASGM